MGQDGLQVAEHSLGRIITHPNSSTMMKQKDLNTDTKTRLSPFEPPLCFCHRILQCYK